MRGRGFPFCSRIATQIILILAVVVLAVVLFTADSSMAFWKRLSLSAPESKGFVLEPQSPVPANPRHSTMEKRFCELGRGSSEAAVFDQCYQLLDKIVNLGGGNYRQNWLLFGDSTVRKFVRASMGCATSFETLSHRCDHCMYLTSTESIDAENWKKPNASLGEGPVGFGLLNPTCNDCYGCDLGINVKREVDAETNNTFEQKIHYFPVEFARDVSTQCPAVGATTTQQAVQYYLKRNYPQRGYDWNMTTCLVSVGFHDMSIVPDIGVATYVKNVKNYIRQIRPFCRTMLWLGMHQVMGIGRYGQSKEKVLHWNKGVLDMLQSYQNDIVFIDTTNRTSNDSEHHDNIHMDYKYYVSFAMFLFKNLTKFCT